MSYCVNCGVELGEELKRCPLCGTPVINPNEAGEETAETFFPKRQPDIKPVSKKELALLLSSMFASVALCCGLLNLVLRPDAVWSLYAVGACAMMWIWFVVPLLLRRLPLIAKTAVNSAALALYVFLIAVKLDGMNWFLQIALPIIFFGAAVVILDCVVIRKGRRSILASVVIFLIEIGLMSVVIELTVDYFIRECWSPAWSLIILAVCTGLSVPLLVVRAVPSLREEVRRRFHL